MADDSANGGEGKEPQPPQPEPCYEAVIRYFPMRNFVAVEGPMDAHVIFLGMLEEAIIIVGKAVNVERQDAPLIAAPSPGIFRRVPRRSHPF